MTVKKQMYEKSIQYNSAKGLDIMYIADPDNHNKKALILSCKIRAAK